MDRFAGYIQNFHLILMVMNHLSINLVEILHSIIMVIVDVTMPMIKIIIAPKVSTREALLALPDTLEQRGAFGEYLLIKLSKIPD